MTTEKPVRVYDREGAWTRTFTGRLIDPLAPSPEDIAIEDIAHALSLLCRFGGHTRTHYSVAEHSIRVALHLMPLGADLALWGLLHDASEAYLVDLPRPVKHAPGFGELYRAAEQRVMHVIAERFGLAMPEPAVVKQADNVMVLTEMRDLLGREPETSDGIRPLAWAIKPVEAASVEQAFLALHSLLQEARG